MRPLISLRTAGDRTPRVYCLTCGYLLLSQQYTKTASADNLCIRRRCPSPICCGLALGRTFRLRPRSHVAFMSNFPEPYMAWFLPPRIFPSELNVYCPAITAAVRYLSRQRWA